MKFVRSSRAKMVWKWNLKIPHSQGGVRNIWQSTHVHAWPLRKDDTSLEFPLVEDFTMDNGQFMQNALNTVGPVDQAKRSVLHLSVSQYVKDAFNRRRMTKDGAVHRMHSYPAGIEAVLRSAVMRWQISASMRAFLLARNQIRLLRMKENEPTVSSKLCVVEQQYIQEADTVVDSVANALIRGESTEGPVENSDDDVETSTNVRRRYYSGTQSQVSNPDLWTYLHCSKFGREEASN